VMKGKKASLGCTPYTQLSNYVGLYLTCPVILEDQVKLSIHY